MCIYAYHLGTRVDQLKDDWNIKMEKTPKDGSGEASPKNDLGRSSTSKFSHGQSDAPKIAARLQAPAAAVHGIR